MVASIVIVIPTVGYKVPHSVKVDREKWLVLLFDQACRCRQLYNIITHEESFGDCETISKQIRNCVSS